MTRVSKDNAKLSLAALEFCSQRGIRTAFAAWLVSRGYKLPRDLRHALVETGIEVTALYTFVAGQPEQLAGFLREARQLGAEVTLAVAEEDAHPGAEGGDQRGGAQDGEPEPLEHP